MGLDLGLEYTGKFEILACVEKVPAFCETIRKNVEAGRVDGNPIIIERDISTLSVDEFLALTGIKLGDVDVLIGVPPCQSFSTAAKRQSTQAMRGTMPWAFLRLVEGIRPMRS